jgi:hypothetical protein
MVKLSVADVEIVDMKHRLNSTKYHQSNKQAKTLKFCLPV